MGGFGDTLAARVAERESQIVLGLDPDPEALWPGVHDVAYIAPTDRPLTQRTDHESTPHTAHAPMGRTDRSPTWRTAVATRVHCCALIDAAGPACVAVKPQLACFERLGAPGWEALEAVIEHARQRGLLVIADGKRGDIAPTARAYAQALFERLRVDLATVNPLLGADAIEPLVTGARAAGAGVLLLVRTSNPGAADVQDLELASGGPVWERLAAFVAEQGAVGVGESGLSDVGAVVGATQPQHLRAGARADAPRGAAAAGRRRAGGPGRGSRSGLPPRPGGWPDHRLAQHCWRAPRHGRRPRGSGPRGGGAPARGGLEPGGLADRANF